MIFYAYCFNIIINTFLILFYKIYCNNNAFSFAEVEDLIAAFNAGMKTDVTGLVRGFSTDGATVTAFVS